MSHPFVETKEMTVGYRGVPLIRDIALRVHRGEILTLIGPNGSGKSTILKSLIRQLALIGGTVYLDGKSLQTLPERDLARTMSVLLTEHVRPELMTCWDVAAAGRYPYTGRLGLLSDEDRAKVDEALALVGADELADRDFPASAMDSGSVCCWPAPSARSRRSLCSMSPPPSSTFATSWNC